MSEALGRRRLLHGALRRWSHSSEAGAFLLRGGLLTQLWAGPQRRQTRDLDLVGLFPFDATTNRLAAALATSVEPDGVTFALDTLRGEVIWAETDFPGIRYHLEVHVEDVVTSLQIDVGFGDPIVPPAVWLDYPTLTGAPARVQAARPELLVAWKLDGLFDLGPKRWQAKDLYDLYLLTRHCSLDLDTLTESIQVAFDAHADPLEQVPDILYDRAWWDRESAQARWQKFRATAGVPVPEDLVDVAATVARSLRPALSRLITFSEGREYLG